MIKKTIYGKGGSLKFRMACKDMLQENGHAWLDVKIFLASPELRNYKEVGVKYGEVEAMRKEYEFGQLANEHEVPNFLKYLCCFACDDTIHDINRRNFAVHNFICKGPGDKVGIMVMPYYALGSLDQYVWNRSNFHVLQNVLHQVAFAILYAYERFSFVHGDLHLGNVLLRASKKRAITYGQRSLRVLGLYPIVMDFGRSYRAENATNRVYEELQRLLRLVEGMERSDLALDVDYAALYPLIRDNTPITSAVYDKLQSIIDGIRIRYARSELPPLRTF